MNPLLEQFLSESREFLQGIGEKLMQLEREPGDADLMNELFRLVHTLKGNSGLFEFSEMTRVLHAGEDLMDSVKAGRVRYSQGLADQLLTAMDFVGVLCDEIEQEGRIDASRAADSVRLAQGLRALIASEVVANAELAMNDSTPANGGASASAATPTPPTDIPEAVRAEACKLAPNGDSLHYVIYTPAQECFYQGDDPFHTVLQTPDMVWGRVVARELWPPLPEFDAYRCVLDFQLLATASYEELAEHYRYVTDQVCITAFEPLPVSDCSGPQYGLSEEDTAALAAIFTVQRQILMLDDQAGWQAGRFKAVARVLANCCKALGDLSAESEIETVLQQALAAGESAPLLEWLKTHNGRHGAVLKTSQMPSPPTASLESVPTPVTTEEGPKFGRRAEDALVGAKSLRVDQAKVDRLMNLIGEMVVSKNALPYLAQRAEDQFGVRELAREIKSQYSVINRIAEEMQDAIMQVRMMAVSFVFQRFPRLVRDISRTLGKEVELVLEGEDTEADKNIIESLADPLIHIIRNSLDHGLETPEVRRACGKPAVGTLTIRASQEADRVLIEIVDDGKGIDPAVIKRKAYEKGIIDEATLERISDRDAIQLVFSAGFSTVETVSDLSGRGVGMDVVRTAVEKVNGAILLESEAGKGTSIRISLPLSMAVTQVMIVESDRRSFGVPMSYVVETVRVPRDSIRAIKHCQATVLRGCIVPLKSLNALLEIPAEPKANADDKLAVLVVRVGGESVGLIVDDFHESVDVIQKPLTGILSSLSAYSGSALMGDGSVLMVLNLKEII